VSQGDAEARRQARGKIINDRPWSPHSDGNIVHLGKCPFEFAVRMSSPDSGKPRRCVTAL